MQRNIKALESVIENLRLLNYDALPKLSLEEYNYCKNFCSTFLSNHPENVDLADVAEALFVTYELAAHIAGRADESSEYQDIYKLLFKMLDFMDLTGYQKQSLDVGLLALKEKNEKSRS